MWTPSEIRFCPRQLDFRDAGLPPHCATSIVADGVEIVNALDLLDLEESPIQIIVCDACGTTGCAGGNRIAFRRLHDELLVIPAFDAMAEGSWELDEYGPPDFLKEHGILVLAGAALVALRERLPGLAALERWPRLSVRESALLMQWDAPGRALGRFPAMPGFQPDLLLAAEENAPVDVGATIDRLLAAAVADPRPAALVDGPPVRFWLDGPGMPEWAPLVRTVDGHRLALMPGKGVAPAGDST
jgi:hypothetical protein